MMLTLGMILLFFYGFALSMMNVTQVIPHRLFDRQRWRKEHDPKAWKRYLVFYGFMAGIGALMILIGLLAPLLRT